MDIFVNGHRIYIELHGSPKKPAVVLLHHGLGAVESWQEQIASLVEREFYVVAYDRWGYGCSDARPSLDLPKFDDDIDDLLDILNRLDLKRAALVGHSDGGTLALYFSAQFPDRVSRLLVIAAHIYIEEAMEDGIGTLYGAYLNQKNFRGGLRRLHGDKTETVFQNWYAGWRDIENLDWDMRPALKQIACPVLVVQGEADEHATPQHARDLSAGLPDSELWLAPGMGHMLPQDYPKQFNSRMIAFLKGSTAPYEMSG